MKAATSLTFLGFACYLLSYTPTFALTIPFPLSNSILKRGDAVKVATISDAVRARARTVTNANLKLKQLNLLHLTELERHSRLVIPKRNAPVDLTLDEIFDPIEAGIKPIVNRLSSKDTTLPEATSLILRLEYISNQLYQFLLLSEWSIDILNTIQVDSRLTNIIFEISHALVYTRSNLGEGVSELDEVIEEELDPALQDVIDIVEKKEEGTDGDGMLENEFRPLVSVMKEAGLHLHVGELVI